MCPNKGFSSPLCSGSPLQSRRQDEGGPAAGGRGRRGGSREQRSPEPGPKLIPAVPRPSSLASIQSYVFVKRVSPRELPRYCEPSRIAVTWPDRQALARTREAQAISAGTRERAGPGAGHSVAGISLASGFLRPAARSVSWRAGSAVVPRARSLARLPRTPRWGGGRRRGCVLHPGPRLETSLRCVREGPEGAGPAPRRSPDLLPSPLLCVSFAFPGCGGPVSDLARDPAAPWNVSLEP